MVKADRGTLGRKALKLMPVLRLDAVSVTEAEPPES